MGKCRECGKEVSTEAKACPHCGAKKPVPKKVGPIGTAIVVLIGLVIFWPFLSGDAGTSAPPPAPTPEQVAAKAKRDATFNQTVAAAKAVKQALRDPDSLTWESIRANDDASVICLEYRAKNGFGGMNREFAVFVKGKASQKPEMWNKHCTQPLTDLSRARHAV